jgi:hypothetical protein
MFCLDAKTGVVRWSAPQVVKFLSAGPERVYAVDKLQRLLSLDTRTGARLDEMDVHAFPLCVANSQTDRIYLGSRQGLFQCLRDPRQTEALVYVTEPKHAEKKAEKEKLAAKKPAEHAKSEKPVAKAKEKPEGMAMAEEATEKKPAKKARATKKKAADEAGAEEKPKPTRKKKGKKGEEPAADPFAKPAKKK